MSDCCSPSGCSVPEKGGTKVNNKCVSCGAVAKLVARQTLLHQLKHSQLATLPDTPFHFCGQTDCDVVYFGEDGVVYKRKHVRQEVGQKSNASNRMLCYCFDVTASTVSEELEQTGQSQSRAFVMEQVKQKKCSCDILNPSGKCCLTDFPKKNHHQRTASANRNI